MGFQEHIAKRCLAKWRPAEGLLMDEASIETESHERKNKMTVQELCKASPDELRKIIGKQGIVTIDGVSRAVIHKHTSEWLENNLLYNGEYKALVFKLTEAMLCLTQIWNITDRTYFSSAACFFFWSEHPNCLKSTNPVIKHIQRLLNSLVSTPYCWSWVNQELVSIRTEMNTVNTKSVIDYRNNEQNPNVSCLAAAKAACDAAIREVQRAESELLNSDKVRADLPPYDGRLLDALERGHWDLWTAEMDTTKPTVAVKGGYARNPLQDICANGVVAIDFGTKSTVVVYRGNSTKTLPMAVGCGDISQGTNSRHYENPTAMHFVNLAAFLAAYRTQAGRPHTKWNDLTISHTALEQLNNSGSRDTNQYLTRLKQWAGHPKREVKLSDAQGKTYDLPSFEQLKDDEFDPIEIYAYYLGLYINDMHYRRIFLDYYLSFPVTFEAPLRQKIVASFERGLKQSLPPAVLADAQAMNRFRVNGEVSEPAAYAACALQEYGFEPTDREPIFYAVFDFGGGTADFDFGLWKNSQVKDYAIEDLHADGDPYLGGENILENLAFDIFRANGDTLREKHITFPLVPERSFVAGLEGVITDSAESSKNLRCLAETLRPLWENPQAFAPIESKLALDLPEQSTPCDGITLEGDTLTITLTLYDKQGQDQLGIALEYSKAKLDQTIEERLRKGVRQFFAAMESVYKNDKARAATKLNILLAGNSSKSTVLRRVFAEIIEQKTADLGLGYCPFEIFPPLGTEEAYAKMEERGITPKRDSLEQPTGKTGVAFGLLQCRQGGPIERIAQERHTDAIPFGFFLGKERKHKFVPLDGDEFAEIGKPELNIWFEVGPVVDNTIELYYTKLPDILDEPLIIDGNPDVHPIIIRLAQAYQGAKLFLRARNSRTLEYKIAFSVGADAIESGDRELQA